LNIYQYVEVSARELDSKLLLAVIAASRGHDVLVSEKTAILNGIRRGVLQPGVFHTKSLTPGHTKWSLHQLLIKRGFSVASIDEEGGLVDFGYDKFAVVRYSEKTIGQASGVFGWGVEDTETLKRVYPEYSSRIHQTGSPRVDLWSSRFDDYWEAPKGMPDKPFLLVSSNMGSANAIRPFHKSIQSEKFAGYFQRDPESFARRFNQIGEDYRTTFAFIEAIQYLADKSNGDYDIVLRPHPVENIEAWKVYLEGIPNVHVIREGSISAWVNNAFAVMHNGCTTALEATISGTPVVTYIPFEQAYARALPNELGIRCESLETLSSEISHLFETSKTGASLDDNVKLPEAVAKKIYLDQQELAAEKIVKVWESLDNGDLSRSCNWTLFQIVLYLVKLRSLVVFTLRSVFPRKFGPNTANHKFPPLEAEDIRGRVRRLQRVLGIDEKLESKLLSERIVLIRKR